MNLSCAGSESGTSLYLCYIGEIWEKWKPFFATSRVICAFFHGLEEGGRPNCGWFRDLGWRMSALLAGWIWNRKSEMRHYILRSPAFLPQPNILIFDFMSVVVLSRSDVFRNIFPCAHVLGYIPPFYLFWFKSRDRT